MSVEEHEFARPVTRLSWCTVNQVPYFEDLFTRLEENPFIQLEVTYAETHLSKYPLKDAMGVGYSWHDAAGMRGMARLIWQVLRERDRTWVFVSWGPPAFALAMVLASLLRCRFFVFTDTPVVAGRTTSVFRRRVRSMLISSWFRSATGVIGTGELAIARLREMGAPEARLHNLPYPLDEDRFVPGADRDNQSRDVVVVCSGRLDNTTKRFDLALRAFARVRETRGAQSLVLRIAGSGPDGASLKALAEDLNLSDAVAFEGWLSQGELADLYRTGDIYLHPTDFEPYGVTVVEALYSGLAVVASTGVGAAAELVTHRNGSTFIPGDLDGLVEALEAMIDSVLSGALTKSSIRASSLKWAMPTYLRALEDILTVER